MKANQVRVVVLAVAIGAAVAGVMIANRKTEPVNASQPLVSPAPVVSKPVPPLEIPVADTMPAAQPPPAEVSVKAKPQKIPAQAAPPAQTGRQNPSIQDPDARAALSFVGADPEADAYWIGAINNPNLSADERQNLIEDLNEDGLSDPKHPGPEDVPLIVNRIRLIEELAPSAMDQVNADAFAEAYKDLVNMLDGQPVR